MKNEKIRKNIPISTRLRSKIVPLLARNWLLAKFHCENNNRTTVVYPNCISIIRLLSPRQLLSQCIYTHTHAHIHVHAQVQRPRDLLSLSLSHQRWWKLIKSPLPPWDRGGGRRRSSSSANLKDIRCPKKRRIKRERNVWSPGGSTANRKKRRSSVRKDITDYMVSTVYRLLSRTRDFANSTVTAALPAPLPSLPTPFCPRAVQFAVPRIHLESVFVSFSLFPDSSFLSSSFFSRAPLMANRRRGIDISWDSMRTNFINFASICSSNDRQYFVQKLWIGTGYIDIFVIRVVPSWINWKTFPPLSPSSDLLLSLSRKGELALDKWQESKSGFLTWIFLRLFRDSSAGRVDDVRDRRGPAGWKAVPRNG